MAWRQTSTGAPKPIGASSSSLSSSVDPSGVGQLPLQARRFSAAFVVTKLRRRRRTGTSTWSKLARDRAEPEAGVIRFETDTERRPP
jgi:hypothetical protein